MPTDHATDLPPDSGRLRGLPSVDRLASDLDAPRALAVPAARAAIDAHREALRADPNAGLDNGELRATARAELRRLERGTLRPVLNATGVVLHTNLGRAPLAALARDALAQAASGYCSLELDLDTGARGSRQDHVSRTLCELTGAQAALVVGNGAGAALLAVAALAGRSGRVIVSRGQLVEIGGGFRVPEVIEQAGATLIEVGTTNRTRLSDYERALESGAGAGRTIVLRVHPSNFRSFGFVEEVPIEPLCGLGVPVVDDLGSGALAHDLELLAEEPDVRRSVAAGVALSTFSADKLLGGPQAGILVGHEDAVAAAARHPLARALRIDKLSLAALVGTLALYRDPGRARREIPTLAMLEASAEELERRAERMVRAVGPRARLVDDSAKVGGGALPLAELHGPAVAIDGTPLGADELASRLRATETPVIGRIRQGRVLLDPRTLSDSEAELAARVVSDVLAAAGG